MLKDQGTSTGGPEISALISKEAVPSSHSPSPRTEGTGLISKGPKQQSGRPWCEHCRKPGHVKDTCWDIHDKPPNWKPRQNSKPRSYQAQLLNQAQPPNIQTTPPSSSLFNSAQLDQLYKIFSKLQNSNSASLPSTGSLAHIVTFSCALHALSKIHNP